MIVKVLKAYMAQEEFDMSLHFVNPLLRDLYSFSFSLCK